MNRLTGGFSKPQLWFSLILFMILGTGLCLYLALKGFQALSHDRMQLESVTFIRPVYKDYNTESIHLDISRKNDEQQSDLRKYIDSVLNISAANDLRQKDYSKDKEFWIGSVSEENKTANDKK